jgi:vitamin B12 transporter
MWGPFSSEFQNRSATNLAFYLQDTIKLWDRWFTTLGMRSDHHNRFGHYNTYRAASTFIIRETGTSLKASYGTGFKAPTLFQLYSSFGDPGLNPETSLGWDAGIEQSFFRNRLQLGATYFQNRINNLIQFSPMFVYENIAKARTQGMEAFITANPLRNLFLKASYTYTDTKDLSMGSATSGDPLLRRPRNKFSINMNYQPHRKVNVNVDVTHIGQRNDMDFNTFPAAEVKLASFTLVNLAVSYDITRNINLFGKLVNMLDTPYETVKGYGAPRISAYGGLRLAI